MSVAERERKREREESEDRETRDLAIVKVAGSEREEREEYLCSSAESHNRK